MGTRKKELANKRRHDYIDMLARVYNLRLYQKELLDKVVQEQFTHQQQIDLLAPSKVKVLEQLLSEGVIVMPRQLGRTSVGFVDLKDTFDNQVKKTQNK